MYLFSQQLGCQQSSATREGAEDWAHVLNLQVQRYPHDVQRMHIPLQHNDFFEATSWQQVGHCWDPCNLSTSNHRQSVRSALNALALCNPLLSSKHPCCKDVVTPRYQPVDLSMLEGQEDALKDQHQTTRPLAYCHQKADLLHSSDLHNPLGGRMKRKQAQNTIPSLAKKFVAIFEFHPLSVTFDFTF